MLGVVLFGSLIACCIPIVMNISPQTDWTCNLSWWMLHIALGSVFGALTAKNAQLRFVFDATHNVAQLQMWPLLRILGGVSAAVVLTCAIASGVGIAAVPQFEYVMNGAMQSLFFPFCVVFLNKKCHFQ